MPEVSGGIRVAVLRLAACSVLVLAIGVSLPGYSGRNDPPATAFARTEGQLLVRAKNISAADPGATVATTF
jgi:hypothetical protein